MRVMFLRSVQDLKANESRLRDINKVASELESEGLMAEEAPMVQAQVRHLHSLNNPLSFNLELNFLHFFFPLHLQQQELLGAAPGKVGISC